MIVLNLRVIAQGIEVLSSSELVSRSVNIYDAVFEFNSDWEGFTKTVVYQLNSNPDPVEIVMTGDTCVVPPEAVEVHGILRIGVYGTNGTQVMPTVWTNALLVKEGTTTGSVYIEPTETTYEQVMELLAGIGGGRDGQILAKLSDIDYDFKWVDNPARYVDGEPGNIVVIDNNHNVVDGGVALTAIARTASLGAAYDSTATYDIGDYCTYNAKLYRCAKKIETAETWAASHWTETTVMSEVQMMQKLIAANEGTTSFRTIQNFVRAGLITYLLQPGDIIEVNKETALSVTISGNITAATVDEDTFVAKIGHAGNNSYKFEYDGTSWVFEEQIVTLADYGIAITGTPALEDKIFVHESASVILFEVVGRNQDTPADEQYSYSLSLISKDVLTYNTIPYSPAQALYVVDAEVWPNGMPAGTYNITLNHGAYNGGTGQDGTYQFTTTVTIPVGGRIRHSSMGSYYSAAASYNKKNILSGTFITYDDSYNTLESGLVTTEGSGGVSLGQTTASNGAAYPLAAHMNYTQRQRYGSNDPRSSVNMMWLNSDDTGATSGEIASWWQPVSEFDMPVKSTLAGWLHGIDPEFLSVIGAVKKRTAFSVAEGYGYYDEDQLIWQPSMTEMGNGTNNGFVETDPSGTFSVYERYNPLVTTDRIKYQGTTARHWWIRSPNPSNAGLPRSVNTSGSLNTNLASTANGVVVGLCII